MKKSGLYFIPILIFGLVMLLGNKLFLSGTISPTVLMIIGVVAVVLLVLVRPKSSAKAAPSEALSLLDDLAKEAFADDPALESKFQSAAADYVANCPKAALNKLGKLAPQCSTDADRYAVAMVSGLCYSSLNEYEKAVAEYNRAVVIHPSAKLAITIGSCQQRLGELRKARDSYEFALDLDPKNIEALSNLATAYVADRKYSDGLETAMQVLELDENHASALATAAICSGLKGDTLMQKHYTDRAVQNGYNLEKITKTISALKK